MMTVPQLKSELKNIETSILCIAGDPLVNEKEQIKVHCNVSNNVVNELDKML